MYIYTYVHTDSHTHIYIYVYIEELLGDDAGLDMEETKSDAEVQVEEFVHRIYTYIYIYICVCLRSFKDIIEFHLFRCLFMDPCMCIYIYIFIYRWCVYASICMYIYIYMFVNIYRERERVTQKFTLCTDIFFCVPPGSEIEELNIYVIHSSIYLHVYIYTLIPPMTRISANETFVLWT